MKLLKFLLVGILFGIVMTKSEAVSWFRIQEMFRFQSFHMYGIIGVAVVAGTFHWKCFVGCFDLWDFEAATAALN